MKLPSSLSLPLSQKEKKKREQIGVELYTVQQQLAKLQMSLEKTHDNYNVVTKVREQAESDLQQLQEWYETKAVESNEQRLGVERYQLELDKLNGREERGTGAFTPFADTFTPTTRTLLTV